MVLITIVIEAYKPTYNWGASHCTYITAYIYICRYHALSTINPIAIGVLRPSLASKPTGELRGKDELGWLAELLAPQADRLDSMDIYGPSVEV